MARQDVSLFTVRQLQGLKNKDVSERIAKVWGSVRPTSQEKAAQIKKLKGELTQEVIREGDKGRGRVVFAKNCTTCHKLFDDGKAIGPELTGSQRDSRLCPGERRRSERSGAARVSGDGHRVEERRVLNGIIKQETGRALTLQTENDVVQVPLDEIDSRATSPVSMMPEGVIEKLTARN